MIAATDGFGLLKPIPLNNTGVYVLEGSQRIWSYVHADTIADVKSVWKWDKGIWSLIKVEFKPMY
jgi:hypothetical protein